MNPIMFLELSLILVIAVVITGIIRALKQPAVIGYILSGIAVGPVVLDLISRPETLETFSHIGIALLLFFVGLSLNPRVIKEVGKVAVITGLGQVIFTSSIGFLIAWVLGFSITTALYLAVALAFSSTIIIMKLLSDKRDLETLYGRLAIGFLIVQDFIAIIILLVISSLNQGGDLMSIAVNTIIKGLGSMLALFIFTVYVMPPLTRKIAKSQEFLLLFSITWCFAVASAFFYLGFSIEAGALLAGITLAFSPYHIEISSKLKPLRDFFLILFFIVLGSQMVFGNIIQQLPLVIGLSLFVLIGNPLIVMIIMGLMGYTKRNSFLAGLTVAQISEFSLIVISMGVTVGHVSSEILSLVTAVGLLTFAGSTYMIMYSNKWYPLIARHLSIFERKGKKVDEHRYHRDTKHDIILFGCNRVGYDILESLNKIKRKFLIIDYDPDIIARLSRQGYDCRYGDANDTELLNDLDFVHAKMVISTTPLADTNLLLIAKIREQNPKTIISVISYQVDDALRFYEEGASYVIMPHFLGGKHFSTMIEQNKLSAEKFLEHKIEHIEHISKRKHAGHEHPRHK